MHVPQNPNNTIINNHEINNNILKEIIHEFA